MAMNLEGKKTELDDKKASIYQKRNDEEPEKDKWKHMNKQERWKHFKNYYLKFVVIGLVVVALIGFFFYKDLVTKKNVVYQCAILNEVALEGPIEEFQNQFVEYLGMNPNKNLSSFHLYFTDSKVAQSAGASVSTDLTAVSSLIFAKQMDGMIASEEDLQRYLESGVLADLTTVLSKEDVITLQNHLYIPEDDTHKDGHPYGIRLKDNPIYDSIFSQGGGIVEDPIFCILVNSTKQDRSEKFLHFIYPQLDSDSKDSEN